ncbi:MAG: helix-turn-helix transcriptional regulator [Solobacterium sp.]|nr:helix-turn-helix transcriptional regulator [Solobacterium sp.]
MKNENVNNQIILKNIQIKMLEQRITQVDLTAHLGLSAAVFNMWKDGKSKSYMKYIDKIADYLGVSVDQLQDTRETEMPDHLTENEKKLIHKLRTLTPDQRQLVFNIFENLP